jgi:acyl carrier protein
MKKMSEIKNTLRKLMAQTLGCSTQPDEIKGEDLITELGITSVDSLEILIAIESEFKITIPDEDLNQKLVSSLDSLESYIREHQLTGSV